MKRIQFSIGDRTHKEIDALAKKTRTHPSNFYGEAISLFLWAVEQKKQGKVVGSMDKAELRFKEIDMPLLSLAEPKPGFIKIDFQRLRNLTTGKLHTDIGHIYEDLEIISGEEGIMTHMLPRFNKAVKPFLQKYVTDERFWDDTFDTSHTGEYRLPIPTAEERELIKKRYLDQKDPLEGKNVLIVSI